MLDGAWFALAVGGGLGLAPCRWASRISIIKGKTKNIKYLLRTMPTNRGSMGATPPMNIESGSGTAQG